MESRTKGEQKFIHEYTRTRLIRWAAHQLQYGTLPSIEMTVCLDYAISKGWVSKDGTRVLSEGFVSAAARCKV